MIVRIQKDRDRPYVVLDVTPLRCKDLSLKARGLWALCMSFPDDWIFRPKHLATLSDFDGEAAIRSGLAELKKAGLASYDQPRKPDGTLGKGTWTIYEKPRFQQNEPDGENRNPAKNANSPDRGYPHAAEPNAAEPDAANHTLRSNDVRSKDRRSNEGSSSNAHAREGVDNSSREETHQDAAAAFLDENGKGELLAQLVARGVDEPVAEKLVARHTSGHIEAILKRGETEARGPGWYVDAFRRGYAIHDGRVNGQATRYVHHQALALLDKYGIVTTKMDPVTNYFDVVQENGSAIFVPTEKMQRLLTR